jgi:branched-chain amino acid transport system permease protein
MYMLGAYVCLFLMGVLGLGYWPALIVVALIMAVAGVILERLAYSPLRNQSPMASFISALGALFVLENSVIAIWGPQGQRIGNPYPDIVEVFGITMSVQRLLVIGIAFLLIVLVQLFIKKTTLGSTIEAVAQNPEGAKLVGINIKFAACLVAPIFILSPSMGSLLGMKAFVIVILGGLGSVPGAIVGGLILGLIEALGGGYLSAAYKDVFGFGALVLILAIKPTGLFGKEVQGR